MNDASNRALLPAGLRDILPHDAEREAKVIEQTMAFAAGYGYERVKPPLVEFEETLFSGAGAATAAQCFRVMDPSSQRMMAVRADMTPQVARIAVSRLAGMPRPLRLSYAGQVLRVKGSQLRPERQFAQVGVELIGSLSPAADAEVAVLAGEALRALGVKGVSVDLSLPTLVPTLLRELNLTPDDALRGGLDHKDAAAVAAEGGAAAPLLLALLSAVGPVNRALQILAPLALPPETRSAVNHLGNTAALIHEAAPDLILTVDPVENRGFEYHTGVTFTLFGHDLFGELGRGGRYLTGNGEPGVGATLFMDTVLEGLSQTPSQKPRRVFVPWSMTAGGRELRSQGWVTVMGLGLLLDDQAEAKRLGCDFFLAADGVRPVS